MPKTFVTLHGGLGNQLFQAAFAIWLRKVKGYEVQLIDPGVEGTPGPNSRVCQLDQLLSDEHVVRGVAAFILHIASLSRKWQAFFGRIGFIRCIPLSYHADRAELLSFYRFLPKRNCEVLVFYGYWQEDFVLQASAAEMRSRSRPELCRRLGNIDRMLLNSGKPCIGDTLLVHVRRGDLAAVSSAILLGSEYYGAAFSALGQGGESNSFNSRAIGIVSDQPDIALSLIQAFDHNAYVIDLEDPLDVLAALSMAHSRILANSTLSIWAGVLSPIESPTVYSTLWDMDQSHGSQLCRLFGWIPVNPLEALPFQP